MARKLQKRLFGLEECAAVGKRYGVARAIRGVARAQHGVISRWREAAAVLACGQACVSHESAAHMFGLPPRTRPSVVHVTTQGPVRREGIRAHENVIAGDEVADQYGVPITTPTRTILDLAPTLESEPDAVIARLAALLYPQAPPWLPTAPP